MKKKKKKKKISYSEAPSGYVTFYNYKEPFMEYEDGFGYQGVLLMDSTTGKVQCHLCGKWLNAINNSHLRLSHGIKASEYKTLTGLAQKTTLISESFREKLVTRTQIDKNLKRRKKGKPLSAKAKKKISEGVKRYRDSMESKNIDGTCPAQLLDRLRKLADELGRTPTIDECIFHETIKKVYGSWTNALLRAGLKPRKNGQNVRYNAHNKVTPVSDSSLLQSLRNFKKRYKREPSLSDITRCLLPSRDTYSKHFGSWKKAKDLAFGR